MPGSVRQVPKATQDAQFTPTNVCGLPLSLGSISIATVATANAYRHPRAAAVSHTRQLQISVLLPELPANRNADPFPHCEAGSMLLGITPCAV